MTSPNSLFDPQELDEFLEELRDKDKEKKKEEKKPSATPSKDVKTMTGSRTAGMSLGGGHKHDLKDVTHVVAHSDGNWLMEEFGIDTLEPSDDLWEVIQRTEKYRQGFRAAACKVCLNIFVTRLAEGEVSKGDSQLKFGF
jgi:hypothetical protein